MYGLMCYDASAPVVAAAMTALHNPGKLAALKAGSLNVRGVHRHEGAVCDLNPVPVTV
jgi:hypothetical protein